VFANMYAETGIYDSAIYYSDISLKYDDDIDMVQLKADAYLGMLESDSSMKYYKKVLQSTPLNTEAMIGVVETYDIMGVFDSSLVWIDKVLSIDSTDSYALYLKSYDLLELKQYKKALVATDVLLAVDSANFAAYFIRGDIYFEIEDYDRAIEAYEKYLEYDPGNELVISNISAANYNRIFNFMDAME